MVDKKILKIKNKKLKGARKYLYVFCLVLGLISTMIFEFYYSTYSVVHFYMGYTCLKLSIFFFVVTTICASAFDRIFFENA